MNATPVMAAVFGLVRVMVMPVETLTGMVAEPKLLVTAGGSMALKLAVAAGIVPASSVVMAPVLLVYSPATVAVTGTRI